MRLQQDYKPTDLMKVSSGLEFKKEYKTFEKQMQVASYFWVATVTQLEKWGFFNT